MMDDGLGCFRGIRNILLFYAIVVSILLLTARACKVETKPMYEKETEYAGRFRF